MWKSLIWKEWHEQRWKLGFGCVLLTTFTFVGLYTRVGSDESIMGLVAFFGAVLLPLLNAMGLVAAEREEGSFQTLIRLPISVRQVFFVKFAMAALVVALPLLASGAIALAIAGNREMPSTRLITLFILSAGSAVVTFLWTSVAGIRQPTEARAAVAGVVIMGAWLLALGVLVALTGDNDSWIVLASPLGLIGVDDLPDSAVQIVVVQVLIVSALWLWGLRQFARPIKTP